MSIYYKTMQTDQQNMTSHQRGAKTLWAILCRGVGPAWGWRGLIVGALLIGGVGIGSAKAIGPLPDVPYSNAPDEDAPIPEELQDIGVEQNLGDSIPLDLTFTDSTGNTVQLGDYFKSGRPVILQLGYYRCPMLCDLVMQGMIDAAEQLSWTPGKQYEIITFSVDPAESFNLARHKKKTMIASVGRAEAADGWHFLVGEQQSITQLSESIGITYKWIAAQQQWAHPAAIVILSPQGKITRYLFGTKFEPQTLRLSMVEAAEGKVGSWLDQALIFCLNYDPTTGQYNYAVMNIMRAGGVLTIILLVMVIGTLLVRESRKRKAAAPVASNA